MEEINNFVDALADIIKKLSDCHCAELIACAALDQHHRGIISNRAMIDKTSADYNATVDAAVNAVTTVLDIDVEKAKDLVKDPKGHFDLMLRLNDLFEEKTIKKNN